jgi:hypothetical protein
MHEEIMYPVCPHRNVPAAFERFLGPDSGGIERFFPDVRAECVDGTLLIVRQQRQRASRVLWEGIVLAEAFVALAAAAAALSARAAGSAVQERIALLVRWRPAGGLPV